jgi:glycolate oxidase FAD binding subunit
MRREDPAKAPKAGDKTNSMSKPAAPAAKSEAIEELERLGFTAKHVERPKTESDVQRIVKKANREGLTVLPVGGGTTLGFAPLPTDLDIALDMTRLADASAFKPLDLTMSAQAGMTPQSINAFLSEQDTGYFLPLDPPQPDRATLGGIYASRASGPMRHRYGTLRDLALGVGAVDAKGDCLGFGGLAVKNVAGYDLTKFFMGSAGRLCVVTKISFRIHPLPEASSLCDISFLDDAALQGVLSDLWASVMIPSAVVITHSPSKEDGSSHMLTAFEGHPKAVERQNRELLHLGEKGGGSGEIHWGRKAMQKGLRSATDPDGNLALRLKVCVPMVHGLTAYIAIRQLIKDFGVKTNVILFAGSGVLHVYMQDPGNEAYEQLSHGIKEIAVGRHGHVFLIRAPREMITSWGSWIDPTLNQHVFKPIKMMLDPKGVFPSLT